MSNSWHHKLCYNRGRNRRYHTTPVSEQIFVVIYTAVIAYICYLLIREPIAHLVGRIDWKWTIVLNIGRRIIAQ